MENKQSQGCKTCKEKGPGPIQIGSIVFGFYVLISSIYGTLELIKHVVSWFK